MENVPASYPLTDEHLTQLNHALRYSDIAANAIDMAKRAGIDVSHHERKHKETTEKLRQVKNVYFPGR